MRQGALILQQRFKPPDPGMGVAIYTKYVELIIANSVTTDELAELMAYYACSLGDLVDRIVVDKMGMSKRRKYR
jgi:hypothetical protein